MEEILQPLNAAIALVLLGFGTGLSKLFKSDYMQEVFKQKISMKPLDISLVNHPFFTELQSFIDVEQHYAHFEEQHRNYIFVNYMLLFYQALHQHLITFCQKDLDKTFKTMDDFEASLQSIYNKAFSSFLIEVKEQFTFNDEMLYKIQIHQEESLEVIQLGIGRILNDTTFDYDRKPNQRKMWRILDSLAQSKDAFYSRTKSYFKGLNGQMAKVTYTDQVAA